MHASPKTSTARRRGRRDRLVAGVVSIAAHLAIVLALVSARVDQPSAAPVPVEVTLVDGRSFAPAPAPSAAAPTPAARPPAPRTIVRRTPALTDVDYIPVTPAPIVAPSPAVGDARGAGVQGVGEGAGGGGAGGGRRCDMAGRLQAALRADPLVRAAVIGSAGKATTVWDGDWVRSGGEDGKGLAAVREAILWEVGFAPAACRAQPMRGLVLISLNDATRLAIGQGEWRWSDLLTPRREAP
jgi:hypothetical protein